ncbi:MAG: amidohydrolase family protein [Anaerolineae bacterium]
MILDAELYLNPQKATAEQLASLERETGIDLAILMPEPTLRPDNAAIRDAAARFPMFLPCACVNPQFGQEAVTEFEKTVREWGFRGLKLMPPKHGYRIVEEIVYPLLEKATELSVPVSVHSGQEPCPPADIGLMAMEFPEVPFIMDHMGYRYSVRQAILAAKHAPNLYLATTAVPEPDFIRDAVRKLGPERVLFGSNGPSMPPDLQLEVVRRAKLGAEAEELVLGGNAARVYGIVA